MSEVSRNNKFDAVEYDRIVSNCKFCILTFLVGKIGVILSPLSTLLLSQLIREITLKITEPNQAAVVYMKKKQLHFFHSYLTLWPMGRGSRSAIEIFTRRYRVVPYNNNSAT
jgi:hypothetical protein